MHYAKSSGVTLLDSKGQSMDMNLVRTFVTVYQQRSYTRAADVLDISQPAVSMSIKRMETDLGVALFVKKGRGIAPTAKAIELAERLQQGMQIIDSALAVEKGHKIYCVEGLSHLVPTSDDLQIKMPPFDQNTLLDQLRLQQVDLAIDTTTNKDNAFNIELVREEPIVVVCRKGHPRIDGASMSEQQFYAEQHAVFKARRDGRHFLELFTSKPLAALKVSREVYNQASMVLTVSDSDDIGVVFKSFADRWASKLELNVLPLPLECQPVPIHMLYHKRMENDAEHRQLRNQVKAYLK